MADDPIEVTVVCATCRGTGAVDRYPTPLVYGVIGERYACQSCNGDKVQRATLAPGSLDEALHCLGLATARLYEVVETYRAAEVTYRRALETALALWRKEHR